jgi:hypothetical protein
MAKQPVLAAQWSRIIQDWQASRLTQAEFCRGRGLSLKSFRYWRYKPYRSNVFERLDKATDGLGRSLTVASAPRFVPVTLAVPAPETPTAPRPIEILLAGGQRVAVAQGFDPETLRQVVAALEDRLC